MKTFRHFSGVIETFMLKQGLNAERTLHLKLEPIQGAFYMGRIRSVNILPKPNVGHF